MSAWPRLIACSVLAAALAAPGPAAAQRNKTKTPAEQAETLSREGQELTAKDKHKEAAEKFRQAIVLSPQGKYYRNLCIVLFKAGDYGQALTSCSLVESNGADAALLEKTAVVVAQIKTEMRAKGLDPDKVDTTAVAKVEKEPADVGGPDDPPRTSEVVVLPQEQPTFVAAPPPPSAYGHTVIPHEYTWAYGGTGFLANGTIGKKGFYKPLAYGLRGVGDYLLWPQQKVGIQAYIEAMTFTADSAANDNLDIFDLGAAAYKHVCFGRACITPLAGLHIALLSPASYNGDVRMGTLGGRAEVSASIALGSRYEHVISATAGLNIYLPALGTYDTPPEMYGLDSGGAAGFIGFGYTYRTNQPFGSSPFFTLD